MREAVIREFVVAQKQRFTTNGIVVCGSYPQGHYGPDSDIDIVFLTREERAVEAEHIFFHEVKFHRLLTSFTQLWRFLLDATEDPFAIAVLHSLSAQVVVIEDTPVLSELLQRAGELVHQRGIAYDPDERDIIILHQKRYRITKVAGQWKLAPADQEICCEIP
jgi:predicted nucleotidyltransferase